DIVRSLSRPASGRTVAATAAEVVLAVAAATGAVAALDTIAPITGLGVIYLLAVLFVAIRRGDVAALVTALLSVLTLNYFFIEPRHQLTIGSSENVAALVVFLIAAVVVGRLAAAARERAREAEDRARLAGGRPAAHRGPSGPADRRRARAPARRGARGRCRGRPPRRRRQDRRAPCHLPRPSLAPDRDHDRGRRPREPHAGAGRSRRPRVGHRRRVLAAGALGRRPARPLQDRGRGRGAPTGLVRPRRRPRNRGWRDRRPPDRAGLR